MRGVWVWSLLMVLYSCSLCAGQDTPRNWRPSEIGVVTNALQYADPQFTVMDVLNQIQIQMTDVIVPDVHAASHNVRDIKVGVLCLVFLMAVRVGFQIWSDLWLGRPVHFGSTPR